MRPGSGHIGFHGDGLRGALGILDYQREWGVRVDLLGELPLSSSAPLSTLNRFADRGSSLAQSEARPLGHGRTIGGQWVP